MSESIECQAAVMDAELCGDLGNAVPDCHERADTQRCGYWLCQGCADALDDITGLGRSLIERGAL